VCILPRASLKFLTSLNLSRFTLALSLLSAVAAHGQTISINSVLTAPSASQIVGDARYRIDNLNWDMAVINKNVTGAFNSNDLVNRGLGNISQLSGDTFAFSLEHRTG